MSASATEKYSRVLRTNPAPGYGIYGVTSQKKFISGVHRSLLQSAGNAEQPAGQPGALV